MAALALSSLAQYCLVLPSTLTQFRNRELVPVTTRCYATIMPLTALWGRHPPHHITRYLVGTIRSHVPARYYSMNRRRLWAPPQSFTRQTDRANNTFNTGQYQSMPSSRRRGPDFLGTTCERRASPKRLLVPIPTVRGAETASDSIKALVKADIRPPVRQVTPARINAITDTPAACHLRYTNHSQVHA